MAIQIKIITARIGVDPDNNGSKEKKKQKPRSWIVDAVSAIALAMLILFYIFFFIGQIVLAVIAFLIACVISLLVLLRARKRAIAQVARSVEQHSGQEQSRRGSGTGQLSPRT